MASFADMVMETTVTSGTGTYNLDGAATGFQSFVSGVGSGSQVYYCCTNDTDWEVGIGTVTDSTPDTLSRDTILNSSNSGSAVSWDSVSRKIFLVNPAANIVDTAELATVMAIALG